MATVWIVLLLWVNLSQVFSLKCLQCLGTSSSCRMVARTCPSYETTCISLAYRSQGDSNTVMKGCSTTNLCNQTSIIDTGNRSIYMSATCCERDYCNINRYSNAQVFSKRLECITCKSPNVSCTSSSNQQSMFCDEVNNNCVDVITMDTNNARVPVAALKCQACEGNSVSCASSNLTLVQCAGVQDRCMTVTTLYANVSRSDIVIKGCGTGNLCDRKLHYNTGKGRVYTEVSCCGSTNCNQGVAAVTVDPTPNGMQCYACNETGKGECTTPTTVSCTGNMTTCLDIVGFPRGNTLMRGCCSKDVCMGLSASMFILPSQKLHCCTGNLCNTGDIASYFKSGSITAGSSVYFIGAALVVLIEVLRTLL